MINDYFKIFFDSYGDSAILLKKDDFTIVDFNKNAKVVYNISFEKKEDIIGKSSAVFEFNFLEAKEFNTILEKIKENGKWKAVLPVKTIKGAVFTAETTISILTYSKIDYLLIIMGIILKMPLSMPM